MTACIRLAALVTALAATLVAAAPLAADTTLGLPDAQFAAYSPDLNMTDPGGAGACSPGPCIIEQDSLPGAWGALRYAPSAGVITSWKVKTADARTGLRLRVGVPGSLGSVSFVAASPVESAAAAGTHVFAARVAISAGQGVHLEWTGGGGSVLLPGGSLPGGGGVSIVNDTIAPPVGSAVFVTPGTYISSPSTVLFLQATVEPDADGDGYGDTSQDCQPANAGSQVCPIVVPPADPVTADPPRADPSASPVATPLSAAPAPRLGAVVWSRARRVISARTVAAAGTTYAIAARSGRLTRRGSCRVSGGFARCSVRVAPGTWRVSLSPRSGGVTGTAVTRRYVVPREART